MKYLIACEKSGVIRRALREAGVDAWSNDLEPAEDGSEFHIMADAVEVAHSGEWDGMIAHPECRYLSSSGLHWNGRVPGRAEETKKAIVFANKLWRAPIKRVILENPRGRLGKALGPSTQVVQPNQFGDDASKETHLWIRGLGLLKIDPAKFHPGRIVRDPRNGRLVRRWSNQTDSGQNRLSPSEERSAQRAETYPGIAAAIVEAVLAAGLDPTPGDLFQ